MWPRSTVPGVLTLQTRSWALVVYRENGVARGLRVSPHPRSDSAGQGARVCRKCALR
jgi:hypothetical protein